MLKEQKGITLIALVITIIVLLILAGITIAMIGQQDSAPNKAAQAKIEQEVGAAKDTVVLNTTMLVSEFYEKKYVQANLLDTAAGGANAGAYIKTKSATDLGKGISDKVTLSFASGTVTLTSVDTDTSGKKYQITGTVEDEGTITWNMNNAGWKTIS